MSAIAWRTGALGDFVLTLPVLHRLADAGPLTVVAPGRYRVLFDRAASWIDADGPSAAALWRDGARRVERRGVAWTAGAAAALSASGIPEVAEGAPRPAPGVHAADHLWSPLVPWFGHRDRPPALPAPPAVALPPLPPQPIVIAPGSGGARKRWPLTRWRAVADRLPGVVWVRGPTEAEEADWGVPTLDDLDLAALWALAGRCRMWLGPDSGPSHLAAAAGARVGVVFTDATDPIQWAPIGATIYRADTAPSTIADSVLTPPTS